MNKNTIKFIFILALIGGVLFSLKILIIKKKIPLQVVFVSPENQAKNIDVNQKIKIDFNRNLTEKEININLYPQTEFSINFENDYKTIILTPKIPFHSSTQYNLVINDLKSNILWQSVFTTKSLESDPALIYESEKYTQENYPLLKFIPYEDENLSITYSQPLTLKVKIKKGSKETIEPLIFNWLRSHGIEPSTHQIEYLIPEPSPAL